MRRSKFEDLLAKIPTLGEIVSKVDNNTKERTIDSLTIDTNFQLDAIAAIAQEGYRDTLIIVDTGHSIPVGIALMNEYGLPVQWRENLNQLDSSNLGRLTSQCKTFADKVMIPKSQTANSLVVLLDCHATNPETLSLPTQNELAERGINRVIVLDEAKFGFLSISESRIKKYLENLKESGFEIKRLGIDIRDYAKSRTMLIFLPNKERLSFTDSDQTDPNYTEGPVEKIEESYYAQNKNGKRYINNKGKFFKLVSGIKKDMNPDEIKEFKIAIDSFESQQLSNSTPPKNPSP